MRAVCRPGRDLRLCDCADLEHDLLPKLLRVLSRSFARQDILLVLDGAPNHRCADLAIPNNILLLFLPLYTPELNPKETLWDEICEKTLKNSDRPPLSGPGGMLV